VSTVHILCPVHNGARYLRAFLDSVGAQTHTDWQLWMVDDGSTDDSRLQLAAAAREDGRIHVFPSPPSRLGAAGAFAWLWARVPADAQWMAFADQDDVWRADKLARSLQALRAAVTDADTDADTPAMVHTDLEVVDAELVTLAPSYWQQAGIVPTPPTFRRLVAQNVATGCTMLLNRALYERAGAIPAGVTMHDAWVACVAALTGTVVALPEPTVRYRQHGNNTLGARAAITNLPLGAAVARAVRALTGPNRVREQIEASARQAALLQERFAAHLSAHDRAFLERYAAIPTLPWWARKRAVAQLHCHPEHGLIRNAGVMWRA
jgi:glycosyltransferase involved in cell wall biosynthesis